MISQSIGWTLIHSLWQGLIIYLLVKAAFGFTRKSETRYGVGVIAMGLMLICSIATFFVLNQKDSAAQTFNLTIDATTVGGAATTSVLDFINQNIVWLLRFWTLGFVAGMLRIAGGLFYINRLRRNANPVSEEWAELVNSLSESLKITKVVTMAEAAISSPMVVGFVKPVILFPVGLLSGLTIHQVEAILVHELSHIRRQDYIINLIQSVIETIFFFNPFALFISTLIREERENCCDDLVIAKGISPISYVKTLAQLEAAKSLSTLALGIAGNQNQLLNRIKRIMENSAKNDWGKGRLVPVTLLFLGLICASWITIGADEKSEATEPVKAIAPVIAVMDTITEPRRVIVIPEAPNAIVESFEVPPSAEEFEVPAFPDNVFTFDFDNMMPSSADFQFDTIPGIYFDNHSDFDSFENEIRAKMRTQFKDFYSKNQEQIDKMFQELKESRHSELIDLEHAMEMSRLAQNQQKVALDMAQLAQLDMLKEQVRAQEIEVNNMNARVEDFKKALFEQLIKDGYLKPGETLDHLNIDDDNNKMTINGKQIKAKDVVKYKALQDQYLSPIRIEYRVGRSE